MLLHRAHGLGNDYLVVEDQSPLHPARVRALCARHTGVGSDGVLEPVPPPGGAADHGLRIHNPDGSEAEKSGNGLRIYAHWLSHHRGAGSRFRVWTAGGIVSCEVDGDQVTVEMGRYQLGEPFSFEEREVQPVSLGNPHAVLRGAPEDWREIGARLEVAVPGRTNVQFFTPVSAHHVVARIWERGAGETWSSGSSACAVAAAWVNTGEGRFPVRVEMQGGSLEINGDAQTVTQRGPVEVVGQVRVAAAWLARCSAP